MLKAFLESSQKAKAREAAFDIQQRLIDATGDLLEINVEELPMTNFYGTMWAQLFATAMLVKVTTKLKVNMSFLVVYTTDDKLVAYIPISPNSSWTSGGHVPCGTEAHRTNIANDVISVCLAVNLRFDHFSFFSLNGSDSAGRFNARSIKLLTSKAYALRDSAVEKYYVIEREVRLDRLAPGLHIFTTNASKTEDVAKSVSDSHRELYLLDVQGFKTDGDRSFPNVGAMIAYYAKFNHAVTHSGMLWAGLVVKARNMATNDVMDFRGHKSDREGFLWSPTGHIMKLYTVKELT